MRLEKEAKSSLKSVFRPVQLGLLLVTMLLSGLLVTPAISVRAEDYRPLEISATSGPTGTSLTIRGYNMSSCGNGGSCAIVVEQDAYFLQFGMVSLDQNGDFSWTGPLPRDGEWTTGIPKKTMAVPTGPITIGVGIPGNALATVDFNVTDNRQGPYVRAAAWDEMAYQWARTDRLVAQGQVKRSWLWGPVQRSFFEPYDQAPDGWRIVSYHDKARMEVTKPQLSARNNPYYVTNGLLVREMVTGQLQTGDNRFETRQPSRELPAGDATFQNRTPPYVLYAALLDHNPNRNGSAINERMFRTGEVEADSSLNAYGVTATNLVRETNHYIASVFWLYINSSGPLSVVVNNQYGVVQGRLFDPLFAATGLPITEPYWTETLVGGQTKPVLVQLFERRVMTYTPSNPAGFQVEMGNVGSQYYQWRYGQS